MKLLPAVAVVLSIASPAAAQRAKSPADATVFVRLVGSIHADIMEAGGNRTIDVDQVEIGSGSGFVISPDGYVLTNEHVISETEPIILTKYLGRATVTAKISRIEVCFRPETAAARGLPPCSAASVTASDPTLDLAVLLIGGSDFPYVALGDSDSVSAGVAVEALGYPFGRGLEVGRIAMAPDVVPDISTSPGAISALRADDQGDRRFLQITNNVNPGNSGGPVVTRDGFAVGVTRMRLNKATGIGFAIPINQAKDFLESRGLDHLLPVRRLRLGGFQSLESKRIGLRLPQGFVDTSPFRSRVETEGSAADVALRIDRVRSPWTARQIEQALVGTHNFEAVSVVARDGRPSPPSGSTPLLLGGSHGTAAGTNQEIRMDYAVFDLGAEKLVARYVGQDEAMAFNESVLRDSLLSLQGQRSAAPELLSVEKLEWSAAPTAASGSRALPLPAGWIVASSGPSPCPGLPQPAMAAAAFSPDDSTLALRAAAWTAADVAPDSAASACSPRRGSLPSSYVSRADWLGVPYIIEGVFARVASGQVVRLEVSSPDHQSTFAHALLEAWLKKLTQ